MSLVTHREGAFASIIESLLESRAVWGRRLLNIAVAVAVGLLLGKQIYRPDPRIIKAIVGLFVVYAAWRFPIPVSISAFLVMFPFPFPTIYASSNTIFVFLITAMWLAQIVLKTAHPAGRTLLDAPILILLGVYLLSFNNVTNSFALAKGLVNFSTIVACVFAYYLIVHTVRDESTLRRLVRIVTVTALLCFGVGVYELAFPGRPLIRGWILSYSYFDPAVLKKGLRIGGPFGDFELFAEYSAMMFPLILFHFVRMPNLRARIIWGGFCLLNFFVLMATVTRGATLSLLLAMAYLLFRLRKTMSFRAFILTATVSVSAWSAVEFYLSNYTVSGSVLDRLMNTRLVGGLPDSRTFWPRIVQRAMNHLWVGHGPYYEIGEYGREKLTTYPWPHNGYLYYLHTVGLLGTAAFGWILARLWFLSGRLCLNTLRGGYARSLLLVWHLLMTIFIFDQLKIEYLRNPTYQFWPWIVFALTAATIRVVQDQAREARTTVPDRPADNRLRRGARRPPSPAEWGGAA